MQQHSATNEPPAHGKEHREHVDKLRHNALGLLSTAALTAAYMGPALSIYALFGPMTEKVGRGVGFVLIVASVITLLSAVSFGMLAKEMPTAGGLFAWTSAALGESAGLCIGLLTIFYYLVSLVFCPIVFGQYFADVIEQACGLAQVSTPNSLVSWTIGALLMIAIGAYFTYRGIVVSAHSALTLLMIELAVVAALAFTFLGIAIHNGNFTIAPMTLGACNDGWWGVFMALPMGMMCTVCDAAVPTAEETENADRTIPIAILLTCLIVGVWYVIGFSAFAMSLTAADTPDSPVQNVVALMATRVWGSGQILVAVTAMTASLGAFIPIVTASSRMIFALARQGKLPSVFARLHPQYLSPWNAMHVAFAFTLLGMIPVFIPAMGPTKTIGWWGSMMGWFIGIVYVSANAVNIIYYWRLARSRFHPVLNFIVPLTALVVQLGVMWLSAIIEPWRNGLPGQTAQVFMLGATVAAIGYTLLMRNRLFSVATTDAKTNTQDLH